ncbi:MAG TPA: CheR family methyltransferase [Arenimonas sp.]|nr:CheR family methyltransferase [Arenimonas sp.]
MIQWRNHEIEEIEVDLVLQALKLRYGFDFTGYARASLKRRLREVQAYFDLRSLSALIPTLLQDERVAESVINNISVPVSEFFRDPPVWRYLREEVLPRLESFPRINIWQPGCGRGQETYTLMILLHEAGLLSKTRLVATDINVAALDQARAGRWPAREYETWDAAYRAAGGQHALSDYLSKNGEEMRAVEFLRKAAEFIPHNLAIDDVFCETQLIVCRNVMIYFAEALQKRVLDLFARSLQRGGYLLLGYSERLPLGCWEKDFKLVSESNVYRRIGDRHG